MRIADAEARAASSETRLTDAEARAASAEERAETLARRVERAEATLEAKTAEWRRAVSAVSSDDWTAIPGGKPAGVGALHAFVAVEASAEESATIRALVHALPRVSPHVLIQHRIELLPLYGRAMCRCDRSELRRLATRLLSLVKRPGAEHVAATAETFAGVVSRVGDAAAMESILPAIDEEAHHAAPERRSAAAEFWAPPPRRGASLARARCSTRSRAPPFAAIPNPGRNRRDPKRRRAPRRGRREERCRSRAAEERSRGSRAGEERSRGFVREERSRGFVLALLVLLVLLALRSVPVSSIASRIPRRRVSRRDARRDARRRRVGRRLRTRRRDARARGVRLARVASLGRRRGTRAIVPPRRRRRGETRFSSEGRALATVARDDVASTRGGARALFAVVSPRRGGCRDAPSNRARGSAGRRRRRAATRRADAWDAARRAAGESPRVQSRSRKR